MPGSIKKSSASGKKIKPLQNASQGGTRSHQAPSVADSDAHEIISESAISGITGHRSEPSGGITRVQRINQANMRMANNSKSDIGKSEKGGQASDNIARNNSIRAGMAIVQSKRVPSTGN